MLCYVMLCYVMLCYVMLCYVMLCYVMLCYDMLCYVLLTNLSQKLEVSPNRFQLQGKSRSPLPGAYNCHIIVSRRFHRPFFLDRIFDKFRLPREPRLLITSFANLIIKLSVIKSPWRFSQ